MEEEILEPLEKEEEVEEQDHKPLGNYRAYMERFQKVQEAAIQRKISLRKRKQQMRQV